MTDLPTCNCPRAEHTHGTRAMRVIHGCRCFHCRVAHSASARAYRAGKSWHEAPFVSSVGTQRRLRALAAIGWSSNMLAPLLEMSPDNVSHLRRENNQPLMRASTHARVVEVYDKLWDKPNASPHGRRTATVAANHGCKPPMAYDDDTIDIPEQIKQKHDDYPDPILLDSTRSKRCSMSRKVDRIAVAERIAGRPVPLNRAEVSDAVRTMTDMNYTARQIAERLGVDPRSVVRYRAEIRKRDAA